MFTYECVNLLQDLHKLLDRGFYSPIEFAESFSLQILGQKTLWRNDALFQVSLWGWQKTPSQAVMKQLHPGSTFPSRLGQTAGPQLHLSENQQSQPWAFSSTIIGCRPVYLTWPTGATNASRGLALLKPPSPQWIPAHQRQMWRAQGLEFDRPGLQFWLLGTGWWA